MAQADVIEFLESEYYKDPERKFTKREIENGIKMGIKDHSLITLVKYGEVTREREKLIGKRGYVYRQYRYGYVPNGPFKIISFRRSD